MEEGRRKKGKVRREKEKAESSKYKVGSGRYLSEAQCRCAGHLSAFDTKTSTVRTTVAPREAGLFVDLGFGVRLVLFRENLVAHPDHDCSWL